MIRYAVTGGAVLSGVPAEREAELVRRAARWAAEGIEFVQLREKSMAMGPLVELARKLVALLAPKTKLLVNGRADVAIAAGAAGVHLTAHPDELTPAQVRRIFALAGAAHPVISVSCHSVEACQRARVAGVDIVLFGPVFEKRVEGNLFFEGIGIEALRGACVAASPAKVLALGGVTLANTQQCLAVGAAGVAGIRLFR